GTDVACTGRPCESAHSTTQSLSTPPPSPPSAAISNVKGLASVMSGRLERIDECLAHARLEAVPARRVADDLGAPERRAQHRCVRDLAAQAAAHAVVGDVRDRVDLQRVGRRPDGEGGAARQADARVIAGAGVLVDAEAGAHDALALLQHPRAQRLEATLPLELALR